MEFLLKKLQDIDVDAFQIAIRNLVLVVLLVKGDHFKLLMMSILSLAHEYGRSAEVLNLCLALALRLAVWKQVPLSLDAHRLPGPVDA